MSLRRRLVTSFCLALLAALAASTQAGGRSAALDLVENGGAEAQAAATTDAQIVTPSGWATTGTFTAAQYGTQGLPASAPAGGSNLFTGGPGGSVSTATQAIDVASEREGIDADARQATLSALLGGWQDQEDSARVRATFLDDSGHPLSSFYIGPVTAEDRNDQSVLLRRSRRTAVPPGTRSIQLVITAERSSGVYNDGYADNVSLVLTARTPDTARYGFGFRIFDRASSLSAGGRGSFTTEGQPNKNGDARVSRVVARDLLLAWNYRGGRFKVSLRFTGAGSYDPSLEDLSLGLTVRSSNFRSCRAGSSARIALDKPGDVTLAFCGDRIEFMAPARASAWIKPA
ncbi:MAG: hypothetical protein ACXVZ1_09685 [Gaiellaceae bacterium]